MKNLTTAIRIFLVLTVITGIIYPLSITGIGKLFFPKEIYGSLLQIDGKIIGSELIGQNFKDPKYFWSRPSAVDYNPLPSGATNLGPISSDLKSKFLERNENGLPKDLLFASGSGLDPHITVEAAKYQISRIAAQRNLSSAQVQSLNNLIDEITEKRTLGIIGEERVNVLKLNLALDRNSF